MRHEKAGRLLELARLLASTAEGLTLDEMAERLGVGRRTAERMRDAVREVFPQLEEVDDPPTRRFRIPAGLDGLFQAPRGLIRKAKNRCTGQTTDIGYDMVIFDVGGTLIGFPPGGPFAEFLAQAGLPSGEVEARAFHRRFVSVMAAERDRAQGLGADKSTPARPGP